MKLVYYSPVLNHHQASLADEFYKIFGKNYAFVETRKCMDKKGGTEDYSTRSYLVRSWESKKIYQEAMSLALNAEVCVFSGYEALPFEKARMKKGLLSFDMGERMLKRGWFNLLSPRILKMVIAYHLGGWGKKAIYKLCIGGFVASDQYKLKTFKGKCYKWGYFTNVMGLKNKRLKVKQLDDSVSLMWCARFIDWKHPELAVKLAKKLKSDGYNFKLNMYGDGQMKSIIQKCIDNFGLTDYVYLKGNLPNEQIQEAMSNHDIFLFLSDEKEGWGVVANEAMTNKCCLVISDMIGSVPYLVKDSYNGMVFKSRSLDSLYKQVKYLIDHPSEITIMAERGYQDIVNLWSPKQAAANFLTLVKDIQNDRFSGLQEGPCSKA